MCPLLLPEPNLRRITSHSLEDQHDRENQKKECCQRYSHPAPSSLDNYLPFLCLHSCFVHSRPIEWLCHHVLSESWLQLPHQLPRSSKRSKNHGELKDRKLYYNTKLHTWIFTLRLLSHRPRIRLLLTQEPALSKQRKQFGPS